MKLKLTQSQAKLLQEAMKSYNTELLTSGQEWRDYDKLYEKLAILSDTSREDDFEYNALTSHKDMDKISQYTEQSYWIDKNNPWKNDSNKRVGKDMDLL